jgi:hypothetical protein
VLDIHGASLLGNPDQPPEAEVLADFLRSLLAGRPLLDLVAIAFLVLGPLVGLVAALTAPGAEGEAGAAARAPLHPRGLALYLGSYLALFTAAYVLSDFTIGRVYHYFLLHRLSQLWLLSILLAAVGLPVLMRGGAPFLGWVLVLGMLGSGAWDLVRVTGQGSSDLEGNWEVLRRTKGYAYGEYVSKVAGHLEGTRLDKLRVLLRFDEPSPAFLHQALAAEFYGDGVLPLEQVLAELSELGVDDPEGFLLGLWPPWKTGAGNDLARRVRIAEARGGPWAQALVEAVGRYGLGALATEDRFERELEIGREQGFPPAYFRGLGYRAWGVRGDRRIQSYWNQVRPARMLDGELRRRLGEMGAEGGELVRGYGLALDDRWIE